MCYGDPYHNTDGEYLRYLEQLEKAAQAEEEQRRKEEEE
jgi:hypothetical protein